MAETIPELGEKISQCVRENKDLIKCIELVKQYKGTDWETQINFSPQTYKRNLAYRSDEADIYILCWDKGQASPIHDHPPFGCLMNVLIGSLTEENYLRIEGKLVPESTRNINQGDIVFRPGSALHKIINNSDQTISMHVYSPPKYVPRSYIL